MSITGKVLIDMRNNGTTGVIDKANVGTVWKTTTATISTNNKIINQPSIRFDASSFMESDSIDSNIFTLGSEDFTFAAWVYVNSVKTDPFELIFSGLFPQADGYSYPLQMGINIHQCDIYNPRYSGGVGVWPTYYVGSTQSYSIEPYASYKEFVLLNDSQTHSVWHHCAFVRSGQKLMYFVDGIKTTETGDGKSITFSNNTTLTNAAGNYFANLPKFTKIMVPSNPAISSLDTSYHAAHFDGYINDFVLVKGQALWTDNFVKLPSTYLTNGGYAESIGITESGIRNLKQY